jgi:heat-inducible transcriptional repressor
MKIRNGQYAAGGIKSAYNAYMNEITGIIEHTAQLLSHLTNYTSFGITPHTKYLNCKYVRLIPIDEHRILMVIVTKEKIVRNYNIRLKRQATESELEKINNVLNICLKDITLNDFNEQIIDKMDTLTVNEINLLQEIIPLLKETLAEKDVVKVYADGMDKNLFPEFFDWKKRKVYRDINNNIILQTT